VLGARHLLALQRDRLGFLDALAARGDAARVDVLGRPVWLLSDPATARSVLTAHQRAFTKSPILRQARVVLGDGLLTAEGETHRRHRRLVQPAFHRARVTAYAEAMVDAADAELATWRDGELVDADAAVHRIALAVTGQTLFGADTRAQAEVVRQAVADVLAAYPTALLPLGGLLRRLPLPPVRRLHAGLGRIDDLVADLVARRRAEPGAARADLLSLLLDTRDEHGDALSDAEVRDEVVTLLLAGHETTAALLAWTVHLLARHADVHARAAAEVAALVDRPGAADLPSGRPLGAAALDRLPFTRAVVAEALRLYPPSYAITRQATEAVDLGGGVRIDAGDVVVVSPWVLHRDGRWWVQPRRFAPERWDGVDPRRPQRAYLPFGAGSRMCIGEGFAWTEAVLVVAALLRGHVLEATGPFPRPAAALTLRPGGGGPLRVRARPLGSASGVPGRRGGRLPP
jgi:cytochrome P450